MRFGIESKSKLQDWKFSDRTLRRLKREWTKIEICFQSLTALIETYFIFLECQKFHSTWQLDHLETSLVELKPFSEKLFLWASNSFSGIAEIWQKVKAVVPERHVMWIVSQTRSGSLNVKFLALRLKEEEENGKQFHDLLNKLPSNQRQLVRHHLKLLWQLYVLWFKNKTRWRLKLACSSILLYDALEKEKSISKNCTFLNSLYPRIYGPRRMNFS